MKIAYIFPGQGSQSKGMGKDFYESQTLAKELIEEASDRLKKDFKYLLFEENDEINQTMWTQPAILLVSSIATKIFEKNCDVRPEFVLGHSLGEFSALVATGALDIIDAVELVHNRGKFMQQACDGIGAGMMVLLGLSDEVVEDLANNARESGKKIWAANYNSDGQIVLAGSKNDLESEVDNFKKAGAKRVVVLPMSVASHCPLLDSAAKNLNPLLLKYLKDEFNYKVISNVTAKEYNSKDEAIKLLSEQLVKPVLYKQSILNYENEVDAFIELGNGVVLKGINKKITKQPTLSINDMKSLEKVISQLKD